MQEREEVDERTNHSTAKAGVGRVPKVREGVEKWNGSSSEAHPSLSVLGGEETGTAEDG